MGEPPVEPGVQVKAISAVVWIVVAVMVTAPGVLGTTSEPPVRESSELPTAFWAVT